MIPQTLPDEPLKSIWRHEDCFSGSEDDYVKAFIHRNYSIGMHTHSFYEVNIVIRGNGVHYIEKRACPVKTGCVFVIPPNIRHGYYHETFLDVYHILIGCRFLEVYSSALKKLPGFPILFEIEPHLRSEYRDPLFLVLDEKQLGGLMPQMQRLIDMYKLSYSGKEIIKNAVTLSIIGELCRFIHISHLPRIVPERSQHNRAIIRSLEYIHLNYKEKITIDSLASQAHLSRSTYIRSFTSVCNNSPNAYLLAYRLKKAKEMLRLTDNSITQIAQECGFYDGSHFQKCFVRAEEISPHQYRRQSNT